MQFINMRELSRFPSKYVKIANEKDDIIITKNGHPYALLSKINDDDLEEYILAKHLDLEIDFDLAKDEYTAGKTTNIHNLINEET